MDGRGLDYAGSTGLDVLESAAARASTSLRYAQAGATATGVDLTPRHVELARAHLAAVGLDATIVLGDAETLPFDEGASIASRATASFITPPTCPLLLLRLHASSALVVRRGSSSTTRGHSTG